MNKAELIAALADKAAVSKKDTEAVLNAFVETVQDTVKKGDTLWGISQALDMTVAELEKLNPDVEAKELQVGEVLKVKGTAAAAKAPVAKQPAVSPSAVRPYPGKPLVLGSRGRNVEALQRALGFTGGAIDGRFGPNTQKAVKNYQSRHNLAVDGSVGPATWNTIF